MTKERQQESYAAYLINHGYAKSMKDGPEYYTQYGFKYVPVYQENGAYLLQKNNGDILERLQNYEIPYVIKFPKAPKKVSQEITRLMRIPSDMLDTRREISDMNMLEEAGFVLYTNVSSTTMTDYILYCNDWSEIDMDMIEENILYLYGTIQKIKEKNYRCFCFQKNIEQMKPGKMMTLSTRCVSESAREYLDDRCFQKAYSQDYYGWFLSTTDPEIECERYTDIEDALAYARNKQCDLLCFDSDSESKIPGGYLYRDAYEYM